jgi:ketosteroid isomerase-like protein
MDAAAYKQLLQRIFAGTAQRDGTLFAEAMAETVTWRIAGQGSWSRIFHGKDSVLRDLLGPLRALLAERSRTVAHRFIAEGDLVVVEARGDNVTKAGARYDNEYCFVFRLDAGKIVEVTEYGDTALIDAVLGSYPDAARAG